MRKVLFTMTTIFVLSLTSLVAYAERQAYEILEWHEYYDYSTDTPYAKIKVRCKSESDLLDNRNFVAVLENGQQCKGTSGSFDMTRTHANEVWRGTVYFGRQDPRMRHLYTRIRHLYYTSSLYFIK